MTKDLILDSAIKVFAKDGFERTSVEDIAQKAGVAKGTLYYHFKSKDEILFSLIERGIDKFIRTLNKNLIEETDPKRKLEIVIETQLEYFYRYKDFCRILLTEIWRFEIKWGKHINQIQQSYLVLIKNILREGIDNKSFNDSLNIEATTSAVFSLVSFASLDWAIFHSKSPKEEMIETIKTIFFNGLTK